MSPALHTGAHRDTQGLGAQVPTSMGRGAQEGREGAHRAQGQEGPAQTMSLTLRGGERRRGERGGGGVRWRGGGVGGVEPISISMPNSTLDLDVDTNYPGGVEGVVPTYHPQFAVRRVV